MAWTLYYYDPSIAAAAIFVVLFGISSLLHFYQLSRTRTWFMIPFFIGVILETIGYIGRLLSSRQSPNWTIGPYVMQSALILIAPAFFAASIYMELGRIIRLLNAEKSSVIKLNWLTKTFVMGDVLSFLMQASGAGLIVRSSSDPSTGEHIIIGGLFVQIIFFSLFLITALVFQIRIAKFPTTNSLELAHVWRKHLHTLYVTSVLILIRSVVRVTEYLQGYDGYLITHEAFIYIFDALLIFLVVLSFHIIFPSEINCFLGRSEKLAENVFTVRKFIRTSDQELQS